MYYCIKETFIIVALNFTVCCFGQVNENTVKINGFVEVDNITYFKNIEGKINGRNQIATQLKIAKDIKDKSRAFSNIEVREDFNDPKRNRVYLKEAYFDTKFKNLDVRIGKQVINWGSAIYVNPTNNINPIDYSDLLDVEDETIGLISANFEYYRKKWKVNCVYMPIFQESILPVSDDSRWFKSVYADKNPLPVNVQYLPVKKADNDLTSGQFAFQVGRPMFGMDVKASYYHGNSHLPKLEFTTSLNKNYDTLSLHVYTTYFKRDVFGLDINTSIAKFGVFGEAAYNILGDLNINYSYLRYVVGVDRLFQNANGYKLYVLVQWIQDYFPDEIEIPEADFIHLFKETLMGQIKLDLGTSTSISVNAIYNLYNEELLIKPEFKYSLMDNLNLYLSSNIIESKNKGFFSVYDNNRLQLRLKYHF